MKFQSFSTIGVLLLSVTASADLQSSAAIARISSELKANFADGVPNPRSKRVQAHADTVQQMLAEYNTTVHTRSSHLIKILPKVQKVEVGHVIGTLASAKVAHDAFVEIFNLKHDAPARTAAADASVARLASMGAVIGYDGAGMDNCGNHEIYLLVLDTQARLVYSIETDPCAL